MLPGGESSSGESECYLGVSGGDLSDSPLVVSLSVSVMSVMH